MRDSDGTDGGTDGLSDTARHVLSAFLPARELTRPDLGRATGLSKPTISTAITELETAGMVANKRTQQGPLGRAANVYGIADTAGWLLGIDIGSTRIELAARSLAATPLRTFRHSSEVGQRPARGEMIQLAAEHLDKWLTELGATHGPLHAAGVAMPKIVPGGVDMSSTLVSPMGDVDLEQLLAALRLPKGTPVLLENNVNCAALAELTQGAAQGRDDFVYLQVGVAIGAGIVANGRLLRGAAGGAGEVAALPFPWAPNTEPHDLALERFLGSSELLRRSRDNWPKASGPKPRTVPDLFEAAAEGNQTALDMVRQHGRDIGNLATALAAVLDPDLIVLGGGVGQNPLLTEEVSRTVHRYRRDLEVTISQLGDDATVEGAVVLTTEHALTQLLGARYQSRLDGRPAKLLAQ